jgi:adenosylcobinamide-GDP ribazoletransferase
VLLLAAALHLPVLVIATLAVGASILLTGALHEDGLADTADGFGGGKSMASALEIMRDSRIGTYGGVALILSLLLRISLIAALIPFGAWRAAAALIAMEAIGRAAMVHLWAALPAARVDGLSSSAGRPTTTIAWAAAIVALVVAIVFGGLSAGLVATIVSCLAAALVTYGFESLCRKMVGGQTGDTLGAIEQIASIVFLLALVAFR